MENYLQDINPSNINDILVAFEDFYNKININLVCDYESVQSLRNAFLNSIITAYHMGYENRKADCLEVSSNNGTVSLAYNVKNEDGSTFYGLMIGDCCDIGITFYKK